MSETEMANPKIAAVLALSLIGCGSAAYPQGAHEAPAPHEPANCDPDLAACESELRAREAELAGVLPGADAAPMEHELSEPDSGAGAPDCGAARGLRDRICELSRAICALTERNPGSAELASRCSAAQASCTRARDDVARACE